MSTIATETIDWPARMARWVTRVNELAALISEWSRLEGWTVEAGTKRVSEEGIGDVDLPRLEVTMPEGRILFEPIGRTLGGGLRVDLEGWPTLSRVKIMGDEWRIVTDSNVPLRVPWNRDSFVQLAHDLVAW
jgi:hypothetical protein